MHSEVKNLFFKSLLHIVFFGLGAISAFAVDPMATSYDAEECLGSAMPYRAPEKVDAYPDSLTPVFINHVGRHGSRFISSDKAVTALLRELHRADSAGVLSPLGRSLMGVAKFVAESSRGRWGALDSLGMAEQRGIATRMYRAYPKVFANGKVEAISSYAPRCVMSMYEFTHQLSRLDNSVTLSTLSGRVNSPLLRPFDVVEEYVEWYGSRQWEEPYDMFFETTVPVSAARRLVGDDAFWTNDEAQSVVWNEYSVLSGIPAMGMAIDMQEYFSREELNAVWACRNLRHYLARTATTLSAEPALIAADLLLDMIRRTDEAVEGAALGACLRFGHAETLMPLLSLMRLRGCHYMTNYFDTVALHWHDFEVSPMSANLQMVLFLTDKGDYCVRFDLNEHPVPLFPDSDDIYVPWVEARDYLLRCLPMYLQP